MIIANKYEVPDSCPEDCAYLDDMATFGQNSICGRCPVLTCKVIDGTEDGLGMFCLIEPADYRDDWAKEWEDFFKSRKVPKLKLNYEGG